uniref:Uncharacterized protein n=1 Tax=Oryza sativa subsp. japonica TaxID=39947 RepID=Q75L72_ORYSJ|nr:hypothetical protein [Oryza sativa Japonica Group]
MARLRKCNERKKIAGHASPLPSPGQVWEGRGGELRREPPLPRASSSPMPPPASPLSPRPIWPEGEGSRRRRPACRRRRRPAQSSSLPSPLPASPLPPPARSAREGGRGDAAGRPVPPHARRRAPPPQWPSPPRHCSVEGAERILSVERELRGNEWLGGVGGEDKDSYLALMVMSS